MLRSLIFCRCRQVSTPTPGPRFCVSAWIPKDILTGPQLFALFRTIDVVHEDSACPGYALAPLNLRRGALSRRHVGYRGAGRTECKGFGDVCNPRPHCSPHLRCLSVSFLVPSPASRRVRLSLPTGSGHPLSPPKTGLPQPVWLRGPQFQRQ